MTNCYICGDELSLNEKVPIPVQVIGCTQCLNISQVHWKESPPSAYKISNLQSLGTLAPRGSVMGGILELVPTVITNLPVLAEIPRRVVHTIHDPISTLTEVSEIIEEDAVLSTRILSLANSAYFATPSEINNLNTACTRLGVRALANIANAMSCANQYRSANPNVHRLLTKLWQHAIVSAYYTEMLVMKLGIYSDTAYFGGLIHDIGKVVLVDAIFNQYQGATGRLKDSTDILSKAIEPFAPLVGLHVAQQWNLSPQMSFSTLFAENPEYCPHKESRPELHCIHLGSTIAESKGYGIGTSEVNPLENHPALEHLSISQCELDNFVLAQEALIDSVLASIGSLD